MSEEIKVGDRVELLETESYAPWRQHGISGGVVTKIEPWADNRHIGTPDDLITIAGWDVRACRYRLRKVAAPAPSPAPSPMPPNPKALYGAQKPDLSLLPPVGLHHAALALEEGARKYGPFNWRDSPVEARTYVAAAMRHLCDYADRTDRASDSDVHNLGHVIACCLILLDATEGGHLIDNRATVPGKSAEVLERLKAWKVERAK